MTPDDVLDRFSTMEKFEEMWAFYVLKSELEKEAIERGRRERPATT